MKNISNRKLLISNYSYTWVESTGQLKNSLGLKERPPLDVVFTNINKLQKIRKIHCNASVVLLLCILVATSRLNNLRLKCSKVMKRHIKLKTYVIYSPVSILVKRTTNLRFKILVHLFIKFYLAF